MRSNLKAALTGFAVLAGVAAVNPALAGDNQTHVMTLRLPDGSVQQIQYSGDVPPQVFVAPAPVGVVPPEFFAPAGFGPSFAMLQRMSAMLDRQAQAMMSQAAAVQSAATNGEANGLPPGMQVYSMSSTIGGNGVCMRSVQITYNGDAKPQMVSHTSGNCGPAQAGAPPTGVNQPRPIMPEPPRVPRTIEVKAAGEQPTLAMAQPASLPR